MPDDDAHAQPFKPATIPHLASSPAVALRTLGALGGPRYHVVYALGLLGRFARPGIYTARFGRAAVGWPERDSGAAAIGRTVV
ncbi:hypothetical protein ACCO45_013562 [Purpureocillium lilacinum]|uniref:Uncharacterized protein n=1 Tax=Purpureocillium lilacinum TaxID=33203 RepID=A0ACC4D997_PURLI